MRPPRALGRYFLLLTLALTAGCGGNASCRVSGTVKYKGEPVKAGLISFIPEGKTSSAAGAPIFNGEYEVPTLAGLPAGRYKVAITSPEFKGKPNPRGPGVTGPPAEEMIPAKYNAETELKASLKSGAENVLDFDLED
jgi:hypothetical protein